MYQEGDWERQNGDIDRPEAWRPHIIRDYGRIIHSASFRRQQGKTQVFPGHESDFFRNRLTHSLEVAQIAEGIADRLNHEFSAELKDVGKINSRLCAAAALVHDIGHPPFGHNGERALDEKMRAFGGFEGNGQTLRILTRLEKKATYDQPVDGDNRAGLNLCNRTLASILKYDHEIKEERDGSEEFEKGYYRSEREIVKSIKAKVLAGKTLDKGRKFKTIECSIMDIADDIAYSVYDLEDSLKAGFLTPVSILAAEDSFLETVAAKVTKELAVDLGKPISAAMVKGVFISIFRDILSIDVKNGPAGSDEELVMANLIAAMQASQKTAGDSSKRTELSSELVHEFINGVELSVDTEIPALSSVKLKESVRIKVEILKQYTFLSTIHSNRVKLGEYRGTDLVKEIFEALEKKGGHLLMPNDVRSRYQMYAADPAKRMRCICDFIAGMTDRYAVEFWARLRSDSAESMFKPI